MYFCPCGLVNWASAFFSNGRSVSYAVVGPVLLHPVDELLLDHLGRRYGGMTRHALQKKLERVPVVSPRRLRHLAALLDSVLDRRRPNAMTSHQGPLEQAVIGEVIQGLKDSQDDPLFNGRAYGKRIYEREDELVSRIREGNRAGAKRVLNEIFGLLFFENPATDILRARALALMGVLAYAVTDSGANPETVFGLEYRCCERVLQAQDVSEMSFLLTEIVDAFLAEIFTARRVRSADLVLRAGQIVRERYAEPLNLQQVASELGFSRGYFSRMFKEQIGLGFSEYLARIRIREAKKLLRHSRQLSYVSQEVGFNDQSYFSKVFKKCEGISPKRWLDREISSGQTEVSTGNGRI